MFQSRNRDTSLFKQTIIVEANIRNKMFQSRNRDTSLFKIMPVTHKNMKSIHVSIS